MPEAQTDDHVLQSHVKENSGKLEPAFAVTIRAPRAEVFGKWNEAMAAGRGEFQLRVRQTDVEPEGHVNFTSLEGESPDFSGQFRFSDASGDRGTVVTATMHVDRGKVQKLFSTWQGTDPSLLLRRDLRRVKQLIEAGEISTNARTREQHQENEGIE